MGFGIYVSPAPGQKWDLSLESVASAIRGRWPEAVVLEEHSMPGRTSLYFHFEEAGRIRIGSYWTVPGETLVIEGADADAVPEIVSWFLARPPRCLSSPTPSTPVSRLHYHLARTSRS